jgi:predicted transcriptional regulator
LADLKTPAPASCLRLRRQTLGISGHELASVANISAWRIYKIERAPLRARVGDLAAVGAALEKFEAQGSPRKQPGGGG